MYNEKYTRLNRYLQDRAMRMDRRRDRRGKMWQEDYRNPYGSRGGYVISDRRMHGLGRDLKFDYRNHLSSSARYDNNNEDPHMAYSLNDYDYKSYEKEYHEDLHEWIDRLKRKDRYGMSIEQVIEQARKYGAKFENYDEIEFYAMFLAHAIDYKDISNDPSTFILMAKGFLEDDDVEMQGSEKVCAYLYDIVLGESKEDD